MRLFRGLLTIAVCFAAVFASAFLPRIFAQEESFVTNLGSPSVLVQGDWLAYSRWETVRGEDLNGDSDTDDAVLHVRNLATDETTNLGLDGLSLSISEHWLVFDVSERGQGRDLNGDGDTEDWILHQYNLATGETTNLRFALSIFAPSPVSADRFLFVVSEGDQGEDLNGDGDTEDSVVLLHNLATGETTTPEIARHSLFSAVFSGGWYLFRVSELDQGEDLNGDGDTEDLVLHMDNVATGETTTPGLAVSSFTHSLVSGDWLVFGVSEAGQGEDLNGDGDTEDSIVYKHNVVTGLSTDLELAGSVAGFSGDWSALVVSEAGQGEDLNGDGDTEDSVVYKHNVATGSTTNLGLALAAHRDLAVAARVSEDWLACSVSEAGQGEDLNGDGDTEDSVICVHNLARGETTKLGQVGFPIAISGDWLVFVVVETGICQDSIVHVHNLSTGRTTNLGLLGCSPISVSGDRLLIGVPEGARTEDLNGDGDTDDTVAHLVDLTVLAALPAFLRGDCNTDGTIDIADPIANLGFQFVGTFNPPCRDALDFDDNGITDVSDPIANLTHQFVGGPPPAPPGKETCGVDPTEDDLTCDSFAACPAGG